MTPLFVGYPVVMTYDVSYVLYLGSRLSALWNCRVDGGNSNSRPPTRPPGRERRRAERERPDARDVPAGRDTKNI